MLFGLGGGIEDRADFEDGATGGLPVGFEEWGGEFFGGAFGGCGSVFVADEQQQAAQEFRRAMRHRQRILVASFQMGLYQKKLKRPRCRQSPSPGLAAGLIRLQSRSSIRAAPGSPLPR